jgi:hypothetical protein
MSKRRHPQRPFGGRKRDALGPGPADVFDMLGRALEVGDMVVYLKELKGVTCIVTAVDPIVDPTAPAGLLKVQLQASFPVTLSRGDTLMGAFLTMLQEDTGWTQDGMAPEPDEKKSDLEL